MPQLDSKTPPRQRRRIQRPLGRRRHRLLSCCRDSACRRPEVLRERQKLCSVGQDPILFSRGKRRAAQRPLNIIGR
jgi:hypothetical protein